MATEQDRSVILDRKRLIAILRDAFRPLKCEPELPQFRQLVNITIAIPREYGDEITLVRSADFLRNPHSLELLVRAVRGQITDRGIELDEWSMPEA